MTDVRADDLPRDDDEDRLPWLEAVDEEERGPSPVKLIAAVVIGLVAIGIIVGGLFWLGNRAVPGAGTGNSAEVIASPGDYKMKAPEPGGMQVDTQGTTQVATSEGAAPNASLNKGAVPEAPVTQPQQPAPAPAQPKQQPQAQAPAPRPAQPAPAQQQAQNQPRLNGPLIQVGAYPSADAAQAEWNRLTQRFPYLRGLNHAVMTYQRGGQTFYRLRAAGGDARGVCARLRAARQPCLDVPAGQ